MDTAEADVEMGLAKFLCNDLGGGVGVEEAVTQDLADDFFGAAIVGFGAGSFGLEGGQATLLEVVEQLIITLAAVAVFLGERDDVLFQTLTFYEHEEAVGLEVGGGDRQDAGGAN
jgi:hypothetical protein